MKYKSIVRGEFLERPNRFVAYVKINGHIEKVHVKNTGRCKELLVSGAEVFLEKSENEKRATAYDLIAVRKGDRLINMDSQAPNKAVEEWLLAKAFFPDIVLLRPETKYGSSRFDFYAETEEEKVFIEVKGVTLEENGVVRFPDAPSERAVKHMEELIAAKNAGFRAILLFVIQMEQALYFAPNETTHKAFAQTLRRAAAEGVEIFAYSCHVTEDGIAIKDRVEVCLQEEKVEEEKKEGVGKISEIPKPLLSWYDKNKRVLPWREEPAPYRVWVSEVMLQQTRVEAVKPYFAKFMETLPDIQSLAQADEETLLKLWEGLGYYNRVRNLQKAAIQIMTEYGGIMPKTYEELRRLKGIGNYTAGAIASIAFGQVQAAVDGNVLRVLSRVRMDERLISKEQVKLAVEQELLWAVPAERPGDFNQAMMEIGACVCLPKGQPLCGECPLQHICMAHLAGREQEYPKKEAARARSVEKKTVLVIQDENKTAVRKRKPRGLLAGMYEFPTLEGFCTAEEVVHYLSENGMYVLRIQPMEEAKHIFTHKEWHMQGYMVRVDELSPKPTGGETSDWLYISPEETRENYPIPSAFAAYTKYLNIKLGKQRYREE